MVACGSRVGLPRYCTLLGEAGVTLTEDDAWQQYWLFAVYSWVAVTRRRAWPSEGVDDAGPPHVPWAGA
jgi:hypothetical protein